MERQQPSLVWPHTLVVGCMPMAHEPQPGLHSCPAGHPGGMAVSLLTTSSAVDSSSSPAAAADLHSPCFSGQLQPRSCCCKLSGRFIKFITVPDFLVRGISTGSPRHTMACLEVSGS